MSLFDIYRNTPSVNIFSICTFLIPRRARDFSQENKHQTSSVATKIVCQKQNSRHTQPFSGICKTVGKEYAENGKKLFPFKIFVLKKYVDIFLLGCTPEICLVLLNYSIGIEGPLTTPSGGLDDASFSFTILLPDVTSMTSAHVVKIFSFLPTKFHGQYRCLS